METRRKSRASPHDATASAGAQHMTPAQTPKSRGPPSDAGSVSPRRKKQKKNEESPNEGGDDDSDAEEDAPDDESDSGAPPELQPGPDLEVRASIPIQLEHESWDAFRDYLNDYMPSTWQNIKVEYVSNVKKRNKELRNSAEGKKGRAVYIPEHFETFKRTYICTHGWPVKSRGSGARPRQRLRHTGCGYGFTACLVLDEADGSWKVGVHSVRDAHNHVLSEEIYKNYCERRVVPVSDPIVDDVRLMLRAGGRPGRIYEYLRQNSGRPVVMKDVHNLISKLRRGKEQLSDDALVADELLTVVLEDEKNVVAVHENEAGYSGVISIATSRMRSLFARYPELVLLDCTHKTNR